MQSKTKNINLLDKLLKFDNDSKLLNYRFEQDNLLMWPFIRYSLYSKALTIDLKLMDISTKRSKNPIKYITYFYKTIYNNPFKISKKYPILIIGSSVGVSLYKDKKWFGRINDYFANELKEKTIVLDNSFELTYKSPRYFNNVRNFDYIRLIAKGKAKLFGRLSDKDVQEIKSIIKYVKSKFNKNVIPINEDYYMTLEKRLISLSIELKYLKKYVFKLLTKLSPKILFMEDASYGGKSYIIRWAKEFGIKIGEFQHGAITKGNLAYNYGILLRNNKEYSNYLPDYILTYGNFWNKNINSSSKAITIGNPYLTEKRKDYSDLINNKSKTILIISDALQPNFFINLIYYLSKNLNNNYKIQFKLHPLEFSNIFQYSKLNNLKNVELITKGDIYYYIVNSDFIVGTISTVLFEAVCFKKPIFVHDSIFSRLNLTNELGVNFKTANELLGYITNPLKPIKLKTNIKDNLWSNNWQNKYKKFINSILR